MPTLNALDFVMSACIIQHQQINTQYKLFSILLIKTTYYNSITIISLYLGINIVIIIFYIIIF